MDKVDEFSEMIRQSMMEEYAKLDKELYMLEQDPDWSSSVQPRRLLVNNNQ